MSEICILDGNTLSHKINTFFYSFENQFVCEVLIAIMSYQRKEGKSELVETESNVSSFNA